MRDISQVKENCLCPSSYCYRNCERCGFDKDENERRKQIPLTLCPDGLRRKIIPRRPVVQYSIVETKKEESNG